MDVVDVMSRAAKVFLYILDAKNFFSHLGKYTHPITIHHKSTENQP
jgi:hypothetical protein